MSGMLTQIGTFLSSPAGKGILTAGTVGTGLTQNLIANNEAQSKQKFVEQLITNPQKFASYVNQFQQPLQAGLTADIARSTDAYGAERGLGSSPIALQDMYAQALAPVLQQQQQQAQQTALSSLGIYENSPTTKPVDVSSILKMLMMGGQQQGQQIPPGLLTDPGLNVMQPSYMPGGGSGSNVPPPLPPSLVGGGGGFDPVTMEGDGS